MVAINGSIDNNELLKILNIILNSITGLILSFISNFKIYEHINGYKILQSKFNKLSHLIDKQLVNSPEELSVEFLNKIIADYDDITDTIEFNYPTTIRDRIKKQYDGKINLPTSLSVDIVECRNVCCNNT
jgi:hypothetical protein